MNMKFLRIVGLGFALAAVAPAKAATVTLVSSPATWKWRKGTNEASNPISAWRAIDYEDSQFTTALAPFWYDTTGDSSTLIGGTQITGMQNVYTSLFLRVTFVLTNTAEIAYLRLG